jgi:hypothetical protein
MRLSKYHTRQEINGTVIEAVAFGTYSEGDGPESPYVDIRIMPADAVVEPKHPAAVPFDGTGDTIKAAAPTKPKKGK